jgi:hypothetical protein
MASVSSSSAGAAWLESASVGSAQRNENSWLVQPHGARAHRRAAPAATPTPLAAKRLEPTFPKRAALGKT